MNKLKKILVPIDDSASSKRALDNAIFLASISDAVITGIYIIHSKSDNGSFLNMMKPLSTLDEKGFVGKQLAEANGVMGDANKKCQKNNTTFEGIVSQGNPGHKIIEFAENKGFDIIIIGMTGKGHTGEIMLGSVSYHVVHHAKMPVLVVK